MKRSHEVVNIDPKQLFRCLTNISLFVFSIIMIFSGLYIQIHYHLQESGNAGFNQWTFVHKWIALLFTLIVIVHVVLHLKWYKAILRKRLLKKNRATLALSVCMLIVSLLGFAPWILSIASSNLVLRHILIEIHDKIALLFMIIMIGHIIKRHQWYLHMR